MQFPVYFHIFGLRIHPHPLMELIAYTGGFQLYRLLRRRDRFAAPLRDPELEIWLLGAALLGALIGSKLLACVESWPTYWALRSNPAVWFSGKTIVGGLLGGWIGVETAKHLLKIRRSTGDAVVFPLALGMAVGRIGCFLTGLDDHTCGSPTSLPWAVNFGDGIPRHPAQLYDIVFLVAFSIVLYALVRPRARTGELFLTFLFGYLFYRFMIEWIKPRWHAIGPISPIQIACLAGMAACLITMSTRRTRKAARADLLSETHHV